MDLLPGVPQEDKGRVARYALGLYLKGKPIKWANDDAAIKYKRTPANMRDEVFGKRKP